MADYNEILKEIDAFVNVLEFELKGAETDSGENIQGVIRVHLRLLKDVQTDSEELYNKMDELNLSIKSRMRK